MTALGMVIGTASLILVVTIALTGKQFLLTQIQNVGANLIWAEYSSQTNAASNAALRDYLTVDDMAAVQRQVPGIRAASPVLNLHDRIAAPGGKERDILVLGVSPEYVDVRRLRVLSGIFFNQQDSQAFNKVALVTETFAQRQFGGNDLALGQQVKISGLPFTIVGTFREGVDTFGRSEIQDDTILIPYSVARRLSGKNTVNQIYFSMADSNSVPRATAGNPEGHQVAASSRIRISGEQSHASARGRAEIRQHPHPGAGPVRNRDPDRRRNRHHEHHVRHRQLPHPRNRHPQSGGGDSAGYNSSIPHGSDLDFGHRRRGRNADRTGPSFLPAVCYRLPAADSVFSARLSPFLSAARWELPSARFPPSGQRRWIRWSASSSTSLTATQETSSPFRSRLQPGCGRASG